MGIPNEILASCKDFCEKLQKLVDWALESRFEEDYSDDEEDNHNEKHEVIDNIYRHDMYKVIFNINNEFDKNALKRFIGYMISSLLKSKKLYKGYNKNAHKQLSEEFTKVIQEYDIMLKHKKDKLIDSVNIYHYVSYSFDSFLEDINLFPTYDLKTLININKHCKKMYSWLVDYANFINQPEKQDFSKEKLPFALKYFSISNFQCIKYIEAKLPVDAQFIVFTGENGDGKTSILQALGLGLYNSNDLTDNERGSENTAIQVQYKAQEESYHNELYNNPNLPILYSLRHKMVELKPFAAYGASRLKVVEKKELQNPLLNLDTDKAKLFDIFESWLRDISVNEPIKYEKAKKVLEDLLPNISEIRKKNPEKAISDFVFVEKGNTVEFKHLSSGHKSIVLMIGDMLIRLSEAQTDEIDDPQDFAGIVFIDELEEHLHPKWQKEFPKILSETFPKVQFIVTTHSAITLLGMPKNTVFFKVKRTEEEGTIIERLEIDVENLLPNQILTSPLFDLDVLPTYNENLNEINTADTFQELQRRKDLDIKLKELSKKLQKTD